MGDGDRTWFATLLEAQGAAQTQVGKSKIKWEWNGPENRRESDAIGFKIYEESEESKPRAGKSLLASSNMGTAILPVPVSAGSTTATMGTRVNGDSVPVSDVAVVEGGTTTRPEKIRLKRFDWDMANGAAQNAHKLGALLASMPLQFYQTAEGDGLLQIDGDRVRRISDARQLNTLLMDNVCVRVFKNGKYHGEQINQGVLATMLKSKVFLSTFKVATGAVTTPVVLSDYTPSQPGYNRSSWCRPTNHTPARRRCANS
jgi:hypothetical protein